MGKVGAPEGNKYNRYSKKDDKEYKPDSDKVSKQYGTSLKYQAGRLKRDRPDLSEQVEHGELSLGEAVRKANIKKPSEPTVRLSAPEVFKPHAYNLPPNSYGRHYIYASVVNS